MTATPARADSYTMTSTQPPTQTNGTPTQDTIIDSVDALRDLESQTMRNCQIVKGKVFKQALKVFTKPSEHNVADVKYFWKRIAEPYEALQERVTYLEAQMKKILEAKKESEHGEEAALLRQLKQSEARVGKTISIVKESVERTFRVELAAVQALG